MLPQRLRLPARTMLPPRAQRSPGREPVRPPRGRGLDDRSLPRVAHTFRPALEGCGRLGGHAPDADVLGPLVTPRVRARRAVPPGLDLVRLGHRHRPLQGGPCRSHRPVGAAPGGQRPVLHRQHGTGRRVSDARLRGAADTRTSATQVGNWQGAYPPVFYATMRLFVSDSYDTSVALMRVANAVIATGLVVGLALLLPRRLRMLPGYVFALTAVPLSLFFIAVDEPQQLGDPERRRALDIGLRGVRTLRLATVGACSPTASSRRSSERAPAPTRRCSRSSASRWRSASGRGCSDASGRSRCPPWPWRPSRRSST